MKAELVEKRDDDIKIKPNLENYDRVYKKFKWENYKNELAWFPNNKFNAAFNAIDKHVNTNKRDKVAMYWTNGNENKQYTFFELSKLSNKFANVLTKKGIKKGDRIFIFLSRVPEEYISFLGALKIGAVAGTLFQAFGPSAVRDRLQDAGAIALITNNSLKSRVYEIKKELPNLKYIILIDEENPKEGEISYWKEMNSVSDEFSVAQTDPEDYAFLLYTSGSTGKPKGVVHSHIAALAEHLTAKWVLDIKDNDIYWCTADPGWVTGIAYEIVGSWSNGATQVIYDGRFDPEIWYKIIEKYKVTIFYSAPTAIRMLMNAGKEVADRYNLSSLRHLCSVGEPLNPEAIRWGKKTFGLYFHDNWWQTETGSIMIANYLCCPIKLGSMGKPFPGIKAAVLNNKGVKLKTNVEGNLALKKGWPSMMKTFWNNEERYKKCFIRNWYISGDRAKIDKDGFFWFIGRADDVIKTSGERVGPFEVESALIEHPSIVEAGVIGKPDPTRGQIIKAFVVINEKYKKTDALKKEIQEFVKKKLAGHAYPREIEFRDKLPKTKSGKIMRRILKAQELGQDIGDTSTLEEF